MAHQQEITPPLSPQHSYIYSRSDSWTTVHSNFSHVRNKVIPDQQLAQIALSTRDPAAPPPPPPHEDADDITESSSFSGSWMRRIGWRRKKGKPDGVEEEPDSVYYGGTMEREADKRGVKTPSPMIYPEQARAVSPAMPPAVPIKKTSSFQRITSWLTRSTTNDVDDLSIADFKDSEWTPPDSSYGAAIPVGGWIPKNVRRLIEWIMIACLLLAAGYVVVVASIRISDQRDSSGNANLYLDDDRYIEYEQTNDDVDDGYNATATTDDAVVSNDDYTDDANKNDGYNGYYNNNDAYAKNDDAYGYYSANQDDDDAYRLRRLN
jgi:hypothetical protein